MRKPLYEFSQAASGSLFPPFIIVVLLLAASSTALGAGVVVCPCQVGSGFLGALVENGGILSSDLKCRLRPLNFLQPWFDNENNDRIKQLKNSSNPAVLL